MIDTGSEVHCSHRTNTDKSHEKYSSKYLSRIIPRRRQTDLSEVIGKIRPMGRSMIGAVYRCNRPAQESMHDRTQIERCRNPLSVARLGTSTKAAPSASPTMRRDGETRYGDRAPQLRHRAQAQYTVRRRALRSEIDCEVAQQSVAHRAGPPFGALAMSIVSRALDGSGEQIHLIGALWLNCCEPPPGGIHQ